MKFAPNLSTPSKTVTKYRTYGYTRRVICAARRAVDNVQKHYFNKPSPELRRAFIASKYTRCFPPSPCGAAKRLPARHSYRSRDNWCLLSTNYPRRLWFRMQTWRYKGRLHFLATCFPESRNIEHSRGGYKNTPSCYLETTSRANDRCWQRLRQAVYGPMTRKYGGGISGEGGGLTLHEGATDCFL